MITTTQCEQKIAQLLGKKHCVLTGNGTTALYAAYSLMDTKKNKVLLPAIMCLNPMLAVHYANKVPVFADVRNLDATIDPGHCAQLLQENPDIGAVVAVALYGSSADMDALRKVCNDHQVLLIEDIAQALGGCYPDQSMYGAKGDCAILSFGYSKILDVGDGGAFVTDNAGYAQAVRQTIDQLGPRRQDWQQWQQLYRDVFYTFWRYSQQDPQWHSLFDVMPQWFKTVQLYQCRQQVAQDIYKSLDSLDEQISHRRTLAQRYQQVLADSSSITFFAPDPGWAPWRFSFRITADKRAKIVNYVRENGAGISTWYPCIAAWTPSGRKQLENNALPVARQLEKEIVNVWVDKTYNEQKVEAISNLIANAIV